MYKLLKLLSLLTTVFFAACGRDEEVAPSPVKTEPPAVVYGLHGDTYQHQRYVFRVTNLPVDDWTVLEISNVARREIDKIWKVAWIAAAGGQVQFNAVDSFLLLQLTTEQEFASTILEAVEKQIPFIYIFIEKQKISEISSPRKYIETMIELLELVLPPDSFEVTQQGSHFSKDGRPAHYFEMRLVDGSRIKRTAFFRNVSSESDVYQISFWCPGGRYEELVPVYDNIAASVEFRLY
ncbi:MAG: hypothetical protein OXP71_17235 [Candidatus Poribacteria bacterium]|nr:hypothetical protein [Candidatus Poribacteria bacterium]